MGISVKYRNIEVDMVGIPENVRFLATDINGDCWAFVNRPIVFEETNSFDITQADFDTGRQMAFYVENIDHENAGDIEDWRESIVELRDRWWEPEHIVEGDV